MKHLFLVGILLQLFFAAPIAGEESFYYLNEQVFQETYEKLLCQASPEDIQRTLKWYEQHPPTDSYQVADRNILQQCLPKRREGQSFELRKQLRKQLRAALKAIKPDCPENRRPVALDSNTHDKWNKELRSRGSLEKELRYTLIARFDAARRNPPCGTVWKN